MDQKTADEVKRHFNVVAEGLRSEMRMLAEGLQGFRETTNERLDRIELRIVQESDETRTMIRLSFGDLDRRMRSLESRLES